MNREKKNCNTPIGEVDPEFKKKKDKKSDPYKEMEFRTTTDPLYQDPLPVSDTMDILH